MHVRAWWEQEASDKVKQLNASLEEKGQAVEELERELEAAQGRAAAGEASQASVVGHVEAIREAVREKTGMMAAECDGLLAMVEALECQVRRWRRFGWDLVQLDVVACGQVARQVQEAMARHGDAAMERDSLAKELEAVRGELSGMEAAVGEQRDAMERLAGDVRSAMERAEGAELERAGLAMRLGGLEDALATECEVVRAGLEGMEGVCVGLERALQAVEAECGQVKTV